MDTISKFLSFLPLYIGYLGESFFLIALFLIHKKFKTIETYIMFYALLFSTILGYTMQYLMQKPEPIFSESGEIISLTQPSQIFDYSLYIGMLTSPIVYAALLVFAIKLYRK